ncbi:PEP-CTERM sorting domain-containing protein [bacterium]|nr:PEP-CTERM sorting domain-containing protein [bacterium]
MKKILSTVLLALGAAALFCGSAGAFSFDDIRLWAGSGSNRAAMVIDWNDGISPQSIVWGYKWDGTATGKDMFDAVLALDNRLYASMEYWPSYDGYTVYGIGYDLDADGSGFVSGVRQDAGGDEDGYALDSDDHYCEGWFTGYWSYYVAETTGSLPSSWDYSGWGISARTLSDGSWDGWSFVSDMSDWTSAGPPDTPTAATAVPEPGALAGLVTGLMSLGGLALRRRK